MSLMVHNVVLVFCVTNGTQCDTGGIVLLMVHGVALVVLCY